MNNHSLKNTEEKPNRAGSSAAAPAAHTRYPSSPAGATLPEKTQGFVPRLSPKTKPMQHPYNHYNAFCNLTTPTRSSRRTCHHNMGTFMQPFHCDLQPKIKRTNRTISPEQSHNHSLKNTDRGGTDSRRIERSRTRCTQEVPFIAGRSHFTRKNTRFRAQAFAQNEAHVASTHP